MWQRSAIVAAAQLGVKMLDSNGDGAIERKEAGKAVASVKKVFSKAINYLQTMGPMLAMFGGMDAGGMGGMGGMPNGGTMRTRQRRADVLRTATASTYLIPSST